MKKSIVKALSTFLVLVMVLSAPPMAVFAAEFNEQEYADLNNSVGGILICPEGKHVYMTTTSVVLVDCGDYHRVDEVTLYECANCAHSYYEATGWSYDENHYYIRTPAGIDPISGVNIYYYICACGNIA